ncbi:hypothetical protein [Geodermatophilus sabuli]|uniref:Calcium-binding protein n=1 Tax=Geodermatophilus sabuli TaxID=1564158 RepID=A0A285EH70_9ACTN|nr:hypothetical protein [Geodermatophilus sabuli]MBB3086128.1 hypothetical protein [Geodermatophilus sabuli]SNX98468.1 hypothetical protein SAMN06893097_110252 [Geodermatophilus sabuli]
MSKRALSVGILTAGLSVGLAAAAISPAAAQGHEVGGKGSVYFLSGAVNPTGQADKVYAFGNADDEVYYGDWYGHGEDQPMVRRGNAFIVPQDATDGNPNLTNNTFYYGNPGDDVLIGDWDGNGVDTLAIRRGNQFLVKNDNTKSGKADAEFYFGDKGDKVHVGNWDGVVDDTEFDGEDYNDDGDYDDPGAPGFAPDISRVDDEGFDDDEDGDFTDAGDRQPGTGVDNNKDGDFDDIDGTDPVPADIPPTPAKGDTLMIQRGNHFFVKNSLSTGKADYEFYFGDARDADSVLIGNWATQPKAETKDDSAKPAASATAGDQLAIRRGLEYHLSSEISKTALAGKNPKTESVMFYGEPTDTVFVARLAVEPVDAYGKPVTTIVDADGDPVVDDADTLWDESTEIGGDGFGVRR